MADIPDGMVAWTGGDAAPADYAGEAVLYRGGQLLAIDYRFKTIWEHRGDELDIIAYTPTPSPEIAEQPMAEDPFDDCLGVHVEANARRLATPKPADPASVAGERMLDIAKRIDIQATCLEGYAESSGHAAKPVPSVFHFQATHFRDLATELRAALATNAPDAAKREDRT